MKVLWLMTRMSDYMLNCLRQLVVEDGAEVHAVVRAVSTEEAPFEFGDAAKGIHLYRREEMSADDIMGLVETLEPELIVCVGWSDRTYLKAIRKRAPATVAVVTMDNQWRGTLRQWAGLVWSRLALIRAFDFIWVPGARQKRFARMLGFAERQIKDGYYVANRENFLPLRQTIDDVPRRRLVFVGRYLHIKGIEELIAGFIAYHENSSSELELVCIGTGPLRQRFADHPRISHLGFVQPADIAKVLEGGGIFILPSHFEPWGLVAHEFALAGFPLVLSDAVGASDLFLTEKNGFRLQSVTPDSIRKTIAAIDQLSDAELARMSRVSAELGDALGVEYWLAQHRSFLTDQRKTA